MDPLETTSPSHTKLWMYAGVCIIVLTLGVITYELLQPAKQIPAGGGSTTTLPLSGSNGNQNLTGTTTPGTPTLSIASQGSATITINDFLHNGVTFADPSTPGDYILAGKLDFCLKDGSCPQAGSARDYLVVYSANQQFFSIALLSEPLGQARTDAEQFLLTTLGVSKAQLCSLRYYLGTDTHVNDIYGGKNLGFSFCPGATALP